MHQQKQPTERIARQTLGGLIGEIQALIAVENDGNHMPWQMAEDKLREAIAVVKVVQQAIHARHLRPASNA